jgi:hypothetical protein
MSTLHRHFIATIHLAPFSRHRRAGAICRHIEAFPVKMVEPRVELRYDAL